MPPRRFDISPNVVDAMAIVAFCAVGVTCLAAGLLVVWCFAEGAVKIARFFITKGQCP